MAFAGVLRQKCLHRSYYNWNSKGWVFKQIEVSKILWSSILKLPCYATFCRPHNITFFGLTLTDYVFDYNVNYTTRGLLTYYNGNCTIIEIHGSYPSHDYMGFLMPLNQSTVMYVLPKGLEWFLPYAYFPDSVTQTVIDEAAMIHMKRINHHKLPGKPFLLETSLVIFSPGFFHFVTGTCYPYHYDEFAKCLQIQTTQKLLDDNINCTNFLFDQFLQVELFPQCDKASEAYLSAEMFLDLVTKTFNAKYDPEKKDSSLCENPCHIETFELEYFPLNSLGKPNNSFTKLGLQRGCESNVPISLRKGQVPKRFLSRNQGAVCFYALLVPSLRYF